MPSTMIFAQPWRAAGAIHLAPLLAGAIAVLAMFAADTAHSAIYRVVDADGNVTFTDKPPRDNRTPVERIDIDPGNSYRAAALPRPTYEPEPVSRRGNDAASLYQVAITSPANDTSLRDNAGNVTIGTYIVPALVPGHRAILELDGQRTAMEPDDDQILLSNIPRGTHNIRLLVIDQSGATLAESATQQFHLQRASLLLPPTPQPARPNRPTN